MFRQGSFYIGLVIGLFAAAAVSVCAAPTKPATRVRAVRAIGGGTVSLPCNITPKSIVLNDDGSTVVAFDREIGGGHRLRANAVSADGTVFSVDGVAIASPPPAMAALGSTLSQLQPRLNAAYSVASVAAVLCAP